MKEAMRTVGAMGAISLLGVQVSAGSRRECSPYRDELARTRVISADGFDYVVATASDHRREGGYVTGAYPVSRGYLVMLRQPLCELRSRQADVARERHEQLAQVLAEVGVRIVRARSSLARRHNAERLEAKQAAHVMEEPAVAREWGADEWLAEQLLFLTEHDSFSASVH